MDDEIAWCIICNRPCSEVAEQTCHLCGDCLGCNPDRYCTAREWRRAEEVD